MLQAVGAAFALGAPVNHGMLFAGRFTRPFDIDWQPLFFANPCEQAPVHEVAARHVDIEIPDREDAKPVDGKPAIDSSRNLADASPLELVRRLVAEWAELPLSAVRDDGHLLTDLHISSIAVGEIVAEAARHLGLPPPVAPTDYADATLGEVARALEESARTGGSMLVEEEGGVPPGVDSWIRTFTVELVERPFPSAGLRTGPRRQPSNGSGVWRVIAPPDHPLRDSLQEAFDQSGTGGGVVVCLPPGPDEGHVGLLLEGAREVLAESEATRFVLVQHGGGAAAFARTLYLEEPEVTTCIVDVPLDNPKATEWVIAEAMAAVGHTEAHYDCSGRRREPVLRLLPTEKELSDLPLGPSDVLLVTEGGKGIAAECALSLACETGARLALLGRSQPPSDTELAANLQRMAAAGVDFQYESADVTDEEAVRSAVVELEALLGPITAILHGAGTNVPQLIGALDEEAFLRTLAPKVRGARNVLAAVDPDPLRLFITFSSIIARTGMRGEADYALANEWLTRLTERFQAEHPACRSIAIEWSVWSGVGMGERLGRVNALVRQGITPISPDEGVSILHHLVARRSPEVSVVVTGRFGEAQTLKMEAPDLPFLRFLERPRVYYPGVELVADTELSVDTDRYLDDHVFQGERLLPAVMGLEAIAQVTTALAGAAEPPIFEDVRFLRPVVVPDDASVTVRVAALVREPGLVEVVMRSNRTAFQVDHIQAKCRFEALEPIVEGKPRLTPRPPIEVTDVPIDPEHDLYGGILFHSGRFRRLRGYRRLRSTECIAEISPDSLAAWFAHYLPGQLILGDPAARDAYVHGVQACVPHATLLPVAVDRLVPDGSQISGPRFVHARERSREGGTFIYDLQVTDADGCVRELWEGLRLRMEAGTALEGAWVEPLLGPYIERQVTDLIAGADVTVEVDWRPGETVARRVIGRFNECLGRTCSSEGDLTET